MIQSPSLTVRAFAELLEAPLYEYDEKLILQKYPNRAPAIYRIPYYREALNAIKAFFKSNRNDAVFQQAIVGIQGSTMPPEKIAHNVRVIEAFRRSAQRRRNLTVLPKRTMDASLSGVELKFTPDLSATERQTLKHVFYNFRKAAIPANVARATLELGHWVLTQNGVSVAPSDVEFVDLFAKKVHRINRVRPQTMNRAHRNARMVVQLWATL